MTAPDRIITAARGWIGTPWAHAHAARAIGCDCLGLVRGVYAQVTGRPVPVPPYGRDWSEDMLTDALPRWCARAQPVPGAILVFSRRRGGPAHHLAIMSGPDRMIHCLEHRGVREDKITAGWWRRLRHAWEIPEGR